MRTQRTAKDEQDYVDNVLREYPIQTEVIVELREANHQLLKNQEALLVALLAAQESLAVYRRTLLDQTRQCLASDSRCIPFCARHEWHSEDGWHRTNEVK